MRPSSPQFESADSTVQPFRGESSDEYVQRMCGLYSQPFQVQAIQLAACLIRIPELAYETAEGESDESIGTVFTDASVYEARQRRAELGPDATDQETRDFNSNLELCVTYDYCLEIITRYNMLLSTFRALKNDQQIYTMDHYRRDIHTRIHGAFFGETARAHSEERYEVAVINGIKEDAMEMQTMVAVLVKPFTTNRQCCPVRIQDIRNGFNDLLTLFKIVGIKPIVFTHVLRTMGDQASSINQCP